MPISHQILQALLASISLLPLSLCEKALYGVAPHRENKAPSYNPVDPNQHGKVHTVAAARSEKCITFTSDLDQWYYRNDYPWNGTGPLGVGPTEICVPLDDGPGGAMFVGLNPYPAPGTTKLECYLPTHGYGNCDVSLVDGYSLSVNCSASGVYVGGNTDLWKQGNSCDHPVPDQGVCKNDKGYAPAQANVTDFFQAAIVDGQEYCTWVNCGQDYYFPWDADITCHVSGSNGTSISASSSSVSTTTSKAEPEPTTLVTSSCSCASWQCQPTPAFGRM